MLTNYYPMPNIEQNKELKIRTYKDNYGWLCTVASVVTTNGEWESHVMFVDYNLTIERTKVRCTAKAIQAQHDRVLAMLEDIKAQALAHYNSEASQ